MTAIDGDGGPITADALDAAVQRVLEYCERDIDGVRVLLEADEGICADEEDIESSFERILRKSREGKE